jgi:hypothetical protein
MLHLQGAEAVRLLAAADSVVRMDSVPGRLDPPYLASPDSSFAVAVSEQPLSGPWSGATRVVLRLFVERPELLRLTFEPVRSVTRVRWVLDHLLAFRLWIGRRHAVDYLFDVERRAVAFREALEDGGLLQQQARQSCARLDVPECRPACYRLRARHDSTGGGDD